MTGAELRAIRIKHGLSQQAMSNLIGISISGLAKFEQGRVKRNHPFVAEKMAQIVNQLEAKAGKDEQHEA